MERDDEELTGEERKALDSLASGAEPPPELEKRVIGALRLEGRIRGPRGRRLLLPLATAAAAALLFWGGWKAGRSPSSRGEGPRFALLLFEGGRFDRSNSHAAEYAGWVTSLRAQGVAISGEELAPVSRVVSSADSLPGEREALGGFFLVGARDLESAVAIARGCPHLRHGGWIEVRAVSSSGNGRRRT